MHNGMLDSVIFKTRPPEIQYRQYGSVAIEDNTYDDREGGSQ